MLMTAPRTSISLRGRFPLAGAFRVIAAPSSWIAGVLCFVLLSACGGTEPTPTPDPTAAPTRTGSTTTASGKGFLTILTPAPRTAGSTAPTGSTGSTGANSTAARTPALARTPAAGSTPARGSITAGTSTSGPAINACALVTVAELTRAMGETIEQRDQLDESPETGNAQLRGFLSGGCEFGAKSDLTGAKSIVIFTLRKDPGSAGGASGFSGTKDFWTMLKANLNKGAGSQSVSNVGDDAFTVDTQGETQIYVLKGDTVVAIALQGFGADSPAKVVAIATQAAMRL